MPSSSYWQKRLLPLMMRMLVILTIVFFIAGFIQFYFLYSLIQKTPPLAIEMLAADPIAMNSSATIQDQYDYSRWKTLILLENNILQHRYHQAKVFLMSRIWSRYLGFITGMSLALVGSAFILGKLRETPSKIDVSQNALRISILSASPGLILAILGTALMMAAMLSSGNIQVRDASVYIKCWERAFNPQLGSHANKERMVQESAVKKQKALDILKK